MDSTPDITGHEAGRSRFVKPRIDTAPEGALGPLFGSEPAPSGIETMPPSISPRMAPPFDSTFGWVAPSWIATRSPAPVPEVDLARGGADTVLSAAWFQDAADAAEWRAMAAERRAKTSAPSAARSPVRVWVVAAVVGAGALVTTTATGAVMVAVSALLWLA